MIPANIIPDCEAEGIDMRVRYHPSYEGDILLITYDPTNLTRTTVISCLSHATCVHRVHKHKHDTTIVHVVLPTTVHVVDLIL